MKLSVTGLMISLAILWGAAVLIVGLANLQWPGYGEVFLNMIASIYPGYKHAGTLADTLVGTAYAVVDGAGGGLIFALLYNVFARTRTDTPA